MTMFFKQTINKIKFLNKDKESYPDLVWLKKDQENLRQFILNNPAGVRNQEKIGLNILEKVNFTKLNAQESRQFAFLGLRLKPMPIIIPILIAATILTGGGLTAVQAQDALPGQTLYSVKLATEKVQLAFSGQEGDVKLHAKFASKRVGEIEELISQTQQPSVEAVEIKTALIEETSLKLKQEVELSEKGLTALVEKGEDVTELALKVEEATNNHLKVLSGLITNVPVQAQPALKQAYQVSQTGQVSAMEAIIKAGEKGYSETMKPLVEERVKVRLEEAKTAIEEVQGEIKSIVVVKQSGGAGMLIAECADKDYITKIADYIIEGTIKKVESKWNEEKTHILTYTNLAIEKYSKGTSLGNYLQIITPGGTVGDVGEWAEDQPIFHQGKKVRIYFQKINGELFIVCSAFGVEEISQTTPALSGTPATEIIDQQKIKQIDKSMQASEASLEQGNLAKALEEIRNVNLIINEMEATIPMINTEPDVSPAIGFCGDGRCSAPSETFKNCPDDCKRLIPYGDDGINVTANWQTYKNIEYGFAIKHPKDFIINQTDSNNFTIGSQVTPYIVIKRYPSRQNIDFQSFIQEKLVEDFGSLLDVNKIKWTEWAHKEIFNQYAIDAEFENMAGGYTGNVVWTYFAKGDWVYRISALQGYNNMDQKAFQNQILSTFKFI